MQLGESYSASILVSRGVVVYNRVAHKEMLPTLSRVDNRQKTS
jgi:hypothetical protein